MAVNKVDVAAHIANTTQSAGQVSGTIIAKKRGDGIWWAASGLLTVGAVYTMYRPQWLMNVFG